LALGNTGQSPGASIRSSEQGINFMTRKKANLGARITLTGDGQHTLDLPNVRGARKPYSGKTVNSCEVQTTTPHAQPWLPLELIDKRHDQKRIELLEDQRRRRLTNPYCMNFRSRRNVSR
jgi:hypothetical protein